MKLSISKIICGVCGKEHSTNDFEYIGMMGFDYSKMEKDKVYLHDTGTFQVNCSCGYTTCVDKSFR